MIENEVACVELQLGRMGEEIKGGGHCEEMGEER